MKYRKFQDTKKNTILFYIQTSWEIILQKPNFDAFCGTNISLTSIYFNITLINSTASLSNRVIRTPFIWFSISRYVDNDTTKVPILTKIGVCVQLSSSKIWNFPRTRPSLYHKTTHYMELNNSKSKCENNSKLKKNYFIYEL